MNCSNCGAPLTPVDGRNYLHCRFCSTFCFPSQLEDSADRVTPMGSATDLDCPVCPGHLAKGKLDSVPALYCERCRGILVDNEAFGHLVRNRRAEHSGADRVPVPIDVSQYDRKVNCPSCKKPMEVHPYYGPGAVVIDTCGRCSMLWLDHGEIAAIEAAPGVR